MASTPLSFSTPLSRPALGEKRPSSENVLDGTAERSPKQPALSKLRTATKTVVAAKTLAKGVKSVRGSEDHVVHSFAEEECAAFSDFINTRLGKDEQLSHLLPLSPDDPDSIFGAFRDGMLLTKMINIAAPETVDERAINRISPEQPQPFRITENLNLGLEAAKSIGITVVNIGSQDLVERRPHLVLGLVWQLVKMSLLSKINLKENPFLIRLLKKGESLEELLKLPPEHLLLRWANFHLEQADAPVRMTNFGPDLRDSVIYGHLISQIDPEKRASTAFLKNPDHIARAEYIVAQGQRLGAEFHVRPKDIAQGNEKLNLGYMAALFNACPALDPPDEEELKLFDELADDDVGDSREERAFRMWINSLGLAGVYVNNLFDDVRDGLLLLRTMEHVRPGIVCWSKVNMTPRMIFKRVENLNYAVVLGKGPFKFSLVGVQGKDINDGNRKLSLALIWQLMRAHLLDFLAGLKQGAHKVSDADMVRWANARVAAAGRSRSMRDFSDKSLASGLFFLDLLAAVEPRCVDPALVTPGETDEERKLNAKYAITCARKLGCSLFLLWEDITEVRPKMMLSFVASVMAKALQEEEPQAHT